MRLRPAQRVWIAVSALIGLSWLAPWAAAAADGCTAGALKGAYIFALSGFKTAGESAAQRTPFAQSGREIFNGDGTMSGVSTASMNGTIVRLTYKGTYTVKPDCSGTVTFTDSQGQVANYDIFATPSGESFTYVQTDASVVSAGWERRQ